MAPSAILSALLTHAKALGAYERARIGEYKAAPGQGLSFALWVQAHGSSPRGSGLDATTPLLQVTARQYAPMPTRGDDDTEARMLDAADGYLSRLSGAFTLGGLVRNLDLLAEMGQPMTWQFGYLSIDNTLYRTCDLPVRCVLDDEWVQGA